MLQVSGNRSSGPTNGLGCLIVTGLVMVGLFFFLNWLYFKLWYATPVFILLALLINWRVVTGSLQRYWGVIVRNPIRGILSVIVAGFLLPFISMGWVLGALGMNQITKMQQNFGTTWGFGSFDPSQVNASKDTEYAEFEELDSKKSTDNNRRRPDGEVN